MRRLIIVMIAGMVGNVTVAASAPQHGRGADKQSKDQAVTQVRDEGTRTSVQVSFSTHDVQTIRQYYAPRYRTLPHGLRKKLDRNGTLPPGWQKKIEYFPVALERDLAVLPPDCQRGMIDGRAVIYSPKTQVIIDVAVLF